MRLGNDKLEGAVEVLWPAVVVAAVATCRMSTICRRALDFGIGPGTGTGTGTGPKDLIDLAGEVSGGMVGK